MKKLAVEKSTLKWIFAGVFVCCLFSLIVFGADWKKSFSSHKVTDQDRQLTMEMWNMVMGELDSLQNQLNTELVHYKVPVWAVMIFDSTTCPSWWKIWKGYWDRFLVPLQSEWGAQPDGNWEIKIKKENLPAHTHFVVANSSNNWTLWANSYLAIQTSSNTSDNDYRLWGTSTAATIGKTSDGSSEFKAKPITDYMPKLERVLFCVKTSE